MVTSNEQNHWGRLLLSAVSYMYMVQTCIPTLWVFRVGIVEADSTLQCRGLIVLDYSSNKYVDIIISKNQALQI